MKKEQGITLIGLIVTIIVLLILAGVTIVQISGSENSMSKAQEAKEKNEMGELRDILALGVNNVFIERGEKLDSFDNYYKDEETFIKSAKIDEDYYSIEEYEYLNDLATGKISKKNGLGLKYSFQINVITNEITMGDTGEIEESLVETDNGYFIYASSGDGDKIIGLTTKGQEAYDEGSEDFINLVIPQKSSNDKKVVGIKSGVFNNKTKIKKLVLQDNITSLESEAFGGCTEVEELTVPININLSNHCFGAIFKNCAKFKKIKLTKGTGNTQGQGLNYGTYGGNEYYYESLPWYISKNNSIEITLEEGITVIGDNMFRGCSNINIKKMPSSLTKIGEYAFYGCSGITRQITLADGMTSIGKSAFEGCSSIAGELIIPQGITKITERSFKDTGITKLIIHDNVTAMESRAFSGCSNLEDLTIPINLNLSNHCWGAIFENCSGLEKIKLTNGSGNTQGQGLNYGTYGGNEYYYESLPWYISKNNSIEITLEEGITVIGDNMFRGCSNINIKKMPSSLTKIGEYAFYGCSGITRQITLADGMTSIGKSAFEGCSSIAGELIIPQGITKITERSFKDTGITKLIIHDNVTAMESRAFSGCSNLEDLTVPINLNLSNHCWGAIFEGCSGLEKIKLTKGYGDTQGQGKNYGTYGGNEYYYESLPGQAVTTNNSIEVIIDEGVTKIGELTFYNCKAIRSVQFPSSLTYIGNNAFVGTSNVTYTYKGTSEQWENVNKNNNSIQINN